MKHSIKLFLSITFVYTLLVGCGASRSLIVPLKADDNVTTKVKELSENELENWSHLDLLRDTIPGMSVNYAYNEIVKNRNNFV